ncbi:MAG: helix-turn-helix transcriptional regulator [Agathobaculum sp.]|uniref:helix-turn-helix domain-containing protein n=1 Tax=Agathobaculum sp. TaxID=2048138 RepID=UPI0025C35B54|nr:helix-turn-helix transcriptional regulator [Agathobaculum sp.]MCI7125680.1 helix-turn-helix transcriptional regulator [Agathobaculum sp.]MDY3711139.1 helix-turn-helix transcriptional regulator [Agathobaculum sp.]
MASDFSRTLALLRREKKISQRTAAGDLGVSQALLSHYENGLREPGLSFVVRAADYYGVSCDYLLGRSMARDGSAVPAGRMEADADASQEKNQVVQAAALLLELAMQTGSIQLPREIEDYLSVAIYKAYRYIYMADPTGVEAVFRASREHFDYLCDARMREHELRMRTAAEGEAAFGLTAETLHRFPLSPNEISKRWPVVSPAFLTVLQRVSDSIEMLAKNMYIK